MLVSLLVIFIFFFSMVSDVKIFLLRVEVVEYFFDIGNYLIIKVVFFLIDLEMVFDF